MLRMSETFYREVGKHFRNVFGPKFEVLLQKRSMDILLLTVIVSISFQIDVVAVFHAMAGAGAGAASHGIR